MANLPQPESFLELLVHDLEIEPALSALSAGFELGHWRAKQFASHLMEWLPEFALAHQELQGVNHANAVRLMRRAAFAVYDTDKYGRRGEFGELILHAVLRQVMGTQPAVTKIYFKDAANDVVKGFDAVHVVAKGEGLELWLGEAKFYKDLPGAMSAAVESVKEHIKPGYLRAEFLATGNKIDDSWEHAERLKGLLDPNTSLDEIFDALCVPVLLTYDSDTVNSFQEASEMYRVAFEEEVRKAQEDFAGKNLPTTVRIHLFLTPLGSKKELQYQLHQRLKAWQTG